MKLRYVVFRGLCWGVVLGGLLLGTPLYAEHRGVKIKNWISVAQDIGGDGYFGAFFVVGNGHKRVDQAMSHRRGPFNHVMTAVRPTETVAKKGSVLGSARVRTVEKPVARPLFSEVARRY